MTLVLVPGGGVTWFAYLTRHAQVPRDGMAAVRNLGGPGLPDRQLGAGKVREQWPTRVVRLDLIPQPPGVPSRVRVMSPASHRSRKGTIHEASRRDLAPGLDGNDSPDRGLEARLERRVQRDRPARPGQVEL